MEPRNSPTELNRLDVKTKIIIVVSLIAAIALVAAGYYHKLSNQSPMSEETKQLIEVADSLNALPAIEDPKEPELKRSQDVKEQVEERYEEQLVIQSDSIALWSDEQLHDSLTSYLSKADKLTPIFSSGDR